MPSHQSEFDVSTYQAVKSAVQRDASIGRGTYESHTEWRGGLLTRSCVRDVTIDSDEPMPLGGAASAPDPIELMLAALGASLTSSWLIEAELRGVVLARIAVRAVATIDLRGRLGLSPLIRPGVSRIDYSVNVESDAAPETLEAIRVAAEAHAPLIDNLRNPTRIAGHIVRTRTLAAA